MGEVRALCPGKIAGKSNPSPLYSLVIDGNVPPMKADYRTVSTYATLEWAVFQVVGETWRDDKRIGFLRHIPERELWMATSITNGYAPLGMTFNSKEAALAEIIKRWELTPATKRAMLTA